jgi:hypothetical protein
MINKRDKRGIIFILWILLFFLAVIVLFVLYKIFVLGSVAFWHEFTSYKVVKFIAGVF